VLPIHLDVAKHSPRSAGTLRHCHTQCQRYADSSKPSQSLKSTLHILRRGRPTPCERLRTAHDISKACVILLTGCFHYKWVQSSQSKRDRNSHQISCGCCFFFGKLSCIQRPQGFHLSLFEYQAPLELKTQQVELVARSACQWSKLCNKGQWPNEHICSHVLHPVQGQYLSSIP